MQQKEGRASFTSVIVPLYNEERRLSPFLDNLIEFLQKNICKKELILVNDGSTDATLQKLQALSKDKPWINVVSYNQNMGKGYAVKKGVFEAKGDLIIFIDADGSIHPDQMPLMLEHLKDYDVVVGNRGHKLSKIEQPKIRGLLGKTFNDYVRVLFNSPIRDNLCGFKGFKKEVAHDLFSQMTSNRWVFDVELFYYIKKRNYSLCLMPLEWEHKTNSKISLIDPFLMVWELLRLRIKLLLKNGV